LGFRPAALYSLSGAAIRMQRTVAVTALSARGPQQVAVACGVAVGLGGLITLIGWAADVQRLTDWTNDGISMFPIPAICAVVSGVALVLSSLSERRYRPAIHVMASGVAVISALTLFEHITGTNLGIDTLLFPRAWGQAAAAAPMRMGPPASLSFLLIGAALVLLHSGRRARCAAAAFGVAVIAIAALSLIGRLYGAQEMYTVPHLTGIALQTASTLLALGAGLVASLPDHEPLRVLLERSSAGMLARRSLPIVIVLSVALGALRVLIQTHGLVDVAFGTALRTLVEIVLLTGLLWRAVAMLRTHEQELRASEVEIRRQAAQLASFLQTAPIALHRVGSDGIILWANDAELNTFGYTRDEYVGQHIAAFHVDQHAIADILARLTGGEPVREYPARIRCKDGSIKSVLIDSSVLWEAGRFVHTQCFTRDVTEQQQGEETRALLAAIIEASSDAIVSKTLEGIVTSWNVGAERVFGYSAEEMIGQSILRIVPPHRVGDVATILAAIGRGERIEHFESERVRKDGRIINVSLAVSPIIDAKGHIIGASKIARDITESAKLYEAAQQGRAAAEEASHAKDRFLAMLSHELRNPLAAVRNAVTTAALDPARARRALEIARRGTDQLTRLIDDLLEVTRLTQGRITLRRERVALEEIVTRTIDALRPFFDERSLTLNVSLPAQPIEVDGDPARLEQVLGNLLMNAAKFTEPAGQVTIGLEYEDGWGVLRVRDTGIGIAPELLPRIFELFVQADQALDRTRGGLGIGLTVVKQLIEMHAGAVEAHSAGIGRGAEIVVRLPATIGAAQVARTVAAAPPVRRTVKARVLIVEDNADAAESLMMLLELLGLRVRVAHDGFAALVAACANPPDVMLIDIGLPEMDGYELAQRIRQEPALRDVTLVALTGYGREEDRQRALAAGFDYHLVKPVDPRKLDALVAGITPSRLTMH